MRNDKDKIFKIHNRIKTGKAGGGDLNGDNHVHCSVAENNTQQ